MHAVQGRLCLGGGLLRLFDGQAASEDLRGAGCDSGSLADSRR